MVLSGEDVLKVGRKVRLCHGITFTTQELTQEDQVTSAPIAVRVSMSTAVWMVLQNRENCQVITLRQSGNV